MRSSESIVFLPGWGFQASIGREFLPPQARLIDLPLIKTSHSSLENICRLIEERIQPSHPILIGWSLGGLLSIKLYERNPAAYKALILLISTPCFGMQRNWPGVSNEHQTLFKNMLEKPYSVFFSYYLKLMAHPFPASHISSMLKRHIIHKVLFNFYKSYQDILFQSDLRSQFSKIRIPTLVIQGGNDSIVPSQINTYLRELNPTIKYHNILSSGHIPFRTHSVETQNIINNFLKSVP
jgi:pimeloyl-[acyl-carrier protein] methyl ester esterase